jgi:hypothetical protein
VFLRTKGNAAAKLGMMFSLFTKFSPFKVAQKKADGERKCPELGFSQLNKGYFLFFLHFQLSFSIQIAPRESKG